MRNGGAAHKIIGEPRNFCIAVFPYRQLSSLRKVARSITKFAKRILFGLSRAIRKAVRKREPLFLCVIFFRNDFGNISTAIHNAYNIYCASVFFILVKNDIVVDGKLVDSFCFPRFPGNERVLLWKETEVPNALSDSENLIFSSNGGTEIFLDVSIDRNQICYCFIRIE